MRTGILFVALLLSGSHAGVLWWKSQGLLRETHMWREALETPSVPMEKPLPQVTLSTQSPGMPTSSPKTALTTPPMFQKPSQVRLSTGLAPKGRLSRGSRESPNPGRLQAGVLQTEQARSTLASPQQPSESLRIPGPGEVPAVRGTALWGESAQVYLEHLGWFREGAQVDHWELVHVSHHQVLFHSENWQRQVVVRW